jgi:uncharacterized protein (TIGR03032 family)
LLQHVVRGAWWETVAAAKATLLITREYEHLLIGVSATRAGPRVTYLPLPHPSGLVVDRKRQVVHVASTRNPNQLYELRPVCSTLTRLDVTAAKFNHRPLVPVRSSFLPGCLYIHDLALIGSDLHANAVGHNAVVRIAADGHYQRVWWPRCIEKKGQPVFGQNHIQLNSIAAGKSLGDSFFSASADKMTTRRPGHRNYPVDKRGVIFSGRTRTAVTRGLTRPHSARLHEGRVWVDNSGYGEVGIAGADGFQVVCRLPGWTRGLCFCGNVAFVGTSQVIPRFRHYAPGLDVQTSECAVHALDAATGRWLGSMIWPWGNQIFAVDWMPSRQSEGFPFRVGGRRAMEQEKRLFYTFEPEWNDNYE